jgi:RNase P subunit RPR2
MKIVDDILTCKKCGKFPIQIENISENDKVKLDVMCLRCRSVYSIEITRKELDKIKQLGTKIKM